MKELGGFFELELNQGVPYHKNALALNSARNCFKYILRVRKPSKVYLPAYCCDSLIEPLITENISYELYHINENFELIDLPELKRNENLLYINYFALKSGYVQHLHDRYYHSLIVDNTQAFFEKPIPGVDTFYSPRKFFGVSDGGYLYTNCQLDEELEQDESLERMIQLLGRYEKSASEFYGEYQNAETSLINQPIKKMSKITQGILASIDYKTIAFKRQCNFNVIHNELGASNLLHQSKLKNLIPMIYPYLTKDSTLRARLIENKVYVGKYWQDGIGRCNFEEQKFINDLVCIPVDQRLGLSELNRIVRCINDTMAKITK